MALKSLKKKEVMDEVPLLEAEVTEGEPAEGVVIPDEAVDTAQLNEAEKEALSTQAEEVEAKSKQISLDKMEAVVALVQKTFNLAEGSYVVQSFADKGTKSSIALSNEDFDIAITIKDNEKFNIM